MTQPLVSQPGVLTQEGQKARADFVGRIFASIVVDADDAGAMQTKANQAIVGADLLITTLSEIPYPNDL